MHDERCEDRQNAQNSDGMPQSHRMACECYTSVGESPSVSSITAALRTRDEALPAAP